MRRLPIVVSLVVASASAAPLTAGQAANARGPVAAETTAPPAPDAPYSYSVDNRRDPFQSLTAGGDSKAAPRPTAAGIAGIRVDELSVRGIMQSRERLVAMVQGRTTARISFIRATSWPTGQ
jgi:hypothetical protein